MTRPLFLAPEETLAAADIGSVVEISGSEGHHAVTVRRIRVGEVVDLGDGLGLVVTGQVVNASGKDRLSVEVASRRVEPEERPRIVVVQGLAKGDRSETAVETMTEVGVDEIIPWSAARSIAQWKGDRATKGLAKWNLTAREAGKQARRPRLPVIGDLSTTADVCARLASSARGIVLHEDGALRLSALELPKSGEIVLVVGPEGGIEAAELAAFSEAGAMVCRMGTSVLRSSTAGTAAAAVILARSGRWG